MLGEYQMPVCTGWELTSQPAPHPQGRRASKAGARRNMLGISAKQIPQGFAVRKPSQLSPWAPKHMFRGLPCTAKHLPRGVTDRHVEDGESRLREQIWGPSWSILTIDPGDAESLEDGHKEQAHATGSIVIKELEDIHPTLGRAKRAARRGGEGERGKESGTGQELQPEQETSSASSPELRAPPSNWGMV